MGRGPGWILAGDLLLHDIAIAVPLLCKKYNKYIKCMNCIRRPTCATKTHFIYNLCEKY